MMHESTVARIINKVTTAIVNLCQTFISMPENDVEEERVMQQFYEIARFPLILRAIDNTQIRIQSLGTSLE